jgi:Dual specificity phosphatase, catalytic domain
MLQSVLQPYRSRSRGYIHDPIAKVFHRILLGAGFYLLPNFVNGHQITHVINCADDYACPPSLRVYLGKNYTCLNAFDDPTNIIEKHYPAFEAAMDAYLRDPICKNVYVHCQAGMNRSATLVIAYVVKRFRVQLLHIVNHVARQRPCVMTNLHFQDYLVKFASDLINNVGECTEQHNLGER